MVNAIDALRRWLQHAFAVESPEVAEPTPAQRQLIDDLCREVVRRRMTVPAQVLLESSRPLHYVGSQVLQFFAPILSGFFPSATDELACFLEQRGSMEYLARRLEQLEAELSRNGSTRGDGDTETR